MTLKEFPIDWQNYGYVKDTHIVALKDEYSREEKAVGWYALTTDDTLIVLGIEPGRYTILGKLHRLDQ